ncbi:helix-turn-helix domain-containing protein [Methylobacterium sp. Leaf85]|uniref:helix-turn-helix domain-containing protein n=1 Tax=Methylobacterium sp. Leaf85 TaxID=1736241 RepID=UPI0009E6EB93|nr:helix-turn-helix transcriptional regulator [Methylobacterium sp. Leaf85]
MDIQRQVGRNVRKARQAAGLSQWDLVSRLEATGDSAGVDQAYISHLENGRKNPTLTTLWQIAVALDVPLLVLFQD